VSVTHEISRQDGSIVELAFTDRANGNFHIDAPAGELAARRDLVMAGPWTVVRQVHGSAIIDADASAPIANADGAPEADAIITSEPGRAIAVQGADCAPLAFITDSGPLAVAHAGWRGLVDGIVSSVVAALSARGATVDEVRVGPVICPTCYEFGEDDLDRVASVLGDSVRSTSAEGTPALDMRAAIASACSAAGIDKVQFVRPCTACGDGGYSHRARKDTERHALVARIRPETSSS